jgi:hypothetical protein
MAMRNGWGLWHNATPIAKWFTSRKLYHGDDRSAILQKAADCKIKGIDFNVEQEIKYYQEWWLNQYGEECSLENMERDFFEYALNEEDYE